MRGTGGSEVHLLRRLSAARRAFLDVSLVREAGYPRPIDYVFDKRDREGKTSKTRPGEVEEICSVHKCVWLDWLQ